MAASVKKSLFMTKTLLFFLCFVSVNAWSQNDTNGGIVPQKIVVRCEATKRPETTLRIRCGGSLTDSNKPLIVVDGVISDSDELKEMDPDAIERIHILKNTKGNSIYGSKAVNGVILVTTKLKPPVRQTGY